MQTSKHIELQSATLPSLDKQSYADGNGGNGKHDTDSDIKLEEIHGQQYIEPTSKATSHAIVSIKTHTDFNGGNGKDGQHPTEVQETGVIRRALVAPVLLPKLSSDRDQMIAKMKEIQNNGQVALITGDKLGLADSLSELLKQYGFTPIILRHSQAQAFKHGDSQPSTKGYDVDLENSEQVQACLTDCENTFGKLSMLFHLQSFGEESAT